MFEGRSADQGSVRGRFAQIMLMAGAAVLVASCGNKQPGAASLTEPAQHASSGHAQIVTKSGIEMIFLPEAEFVMGSKRGNSDEAPPHPVRLAGFLMDKYEVTQEMWAKAQLPNPSHWQDQPKKPVERVRWRDAKQYCNERSLLEGFTPCYNEKTPDWDCNFEAAGYRLPTEAEWEFACRAGTDGPYDWGEAADKLRQFAWFSENGEEKTHPVGQKKANRWGFYDLYGNVSEWCEDVYSPTYYAESPVVGPHGPASPGKDARRVMRGGNWKSSPQTCRATFRQGERTGDTDACFYTDFCGFRCVRRASAAELSGSAGSGEK
jgi:formylglycine-generating enzyme required for sulfatase activity